MEDKIRDLKAEIFDLQVEMGLLKRKIEQRLDTLNKLKNGQLSKRILSGDAQEKSPTADKQ